MVNDGHLSNDVISEMRSSAYDPAVIEEIEEKQRKLREQKLGRSKYCDFSIVRKRACERHLLIETLRFYSDEQIIV